MGSGKNKEKHEREIGCMASGRQLGAGVRGEKKTH